MCICVFSLIYSHKSLDIAGSCKFHLCPQHCGEIIFENLKLFNHTHFSLSYEPLEIKIFTLFDFQSFFEALKFCYFISPLLLCIYIQPDGKFKTWMWFRLLFKVNIIKKVLLFSVVLDRYDKSLHTGQGKENNNVKLVWI